MHPVWDSAVHTACEITGRPPHTCRCATGKQSGRMSMTQAAAGSSKSLDSPLHALLHRMAVLALAAQEAVGHRPPRGRDARPHRQEVYGHH